MKKSLFVVVTVMISLFSQAMAQNIYRNYALLHGDIQEFPLTLINAYPFLDASVNGVRGKFMFDTGNLNALTLNSHAVPLKAGKLLGTGNVGSGQTFSTFIQDTVNEVRLGGGLIYQNLLQIESENMDFLQDHITPDCLGQIGFGFFKGYLFKLDYFRNKIIFYKVTQRRRITRDFLNGEHVIGKIRFEVRKRKNTPLIRLKIGPYLYIGAFDTGQYGLIQSPEKIETYLIRHHLLQNAGVTGRGDTIQNLRLATSTGGFRFDLPGLERIPSNNILVQKRGMGITESNLVNLGFRFLNQFTTVWDYDRRVIYILRR